MRHLPFLILLATLSLAGAAEKPFAFGSVRFEENHGQTDPSAHFVARARGQQIFFTDRGVLLSPVNGDFVRMEFAGAGKPAWIPASPVIDTISYCVGDSSRWVKNAPIYDRIVWHDVYPGIDVAFYGVGDRLEYDLVVAPGADPSQVRIRFDGAARLRNNPDGSLDISRVLRQRVPHVYQTVASGERHKIAGRFVAAGERTIALRLSAYDRARSLVVDPVIETATYIGGENDDEIVAAADGFVAGNTRSLIFPPSAASPRSSRDVFFRGLGPAVPNTNPRALFYGTYILGGSGDETLAGIGLSSIYGGVWLAGTTTSTDFASSPTNQYKGGASDGFLAFITVGQNFFAQFGSSFYIGGSGEDRITAFLGSDSYQVLVGVTDSADLTTGDVPQKTLVGGKDGFYAMLSQIFGGASNTPTYGYLGGSGDDAIYAISVGAGGHLWMGGQTHSTDFATNGSLSGPSDGFLTDLAVTSLSTTPSVKSATTYLIGGSGDDSIRSLTYGASLTTAGSPQPFRPYNLDQLGFAGITSSPDLPVRNAAQAQFGGDRDGFVGLWNPTVTAPAWLTYLGGSGADEALSVIMNWAGDLYVGGWTLSADLPVVAALQPNNGGGEDGMFAVYDSAGGLQHLTYYGGSGDDRIQNVWIANNSLARIAGSTTSNDLPQRNSSQSRGGQMDGFFADIGSDYFIGPTQLVLAKDGLVSFSIRTGRTTIRQAVTYRSSDPSRVRVVYLGRSADQVTAAPEDNIAIEGLTDSGDVQITVSAPGYTTKTIAVKLYPGAFIYPFGTSASFSTWSNPTFLSTLYRAYDPGTGQVFSTSMGLRSGAPSGTVTWTISDPTIFAILATNGYQLQALKPGQATLTLTVDGYQVIGGPQTVTALTPAPTPPFQDFRLGRDLFAQVPVNFALNGISQTTGYRGTLTARSSDPSRLLLALDSTQPGTASVSLTMTKQPAIWAQALADSGSVQVILTSSEFDGEFSIPVTLEPSVVAYGSNVYAAATGNVFKPMVSTSAGSQAQLLVALQGASGSFAAGYRPGAPALTFHLANSNPQVIELNRLTTTWAVGGTGYTLTALAVGGADLSLTSSSDIIRPATPSIHVDVQPPPVVSVTVPTVTYVGKGLQSAFLFRYLGNIGVDVSVDDPAAALVSTSTTVRGSDHITVQAGAGSSDYTFYIQALKSDGETNVRLHFPNDDRAVRVVLLPSGAGFYGNPLGSITTGYQQEIRVDAFALDRQTGIGVYSQTPMPGNNITVRFRTDGDPVKINQSSATLTASVSEVRLAFTLPAAGQQATLYAESDGEVPVSSRTTSVTISTPAVSSDPVIASNYTLSRDELATYNGASNNSTITSSDPDSLLLSTRLDDPGVASVQFSGSASTLYIHALKDSGSATVKMVTTSGERDVAVAFRPLQLSLYTPNSGTALPLGGTVDFTAALSASLLRPGAGTYHFTVRSSNPAVATIDPPSFDLGGPKRLSSTPLHVSGVAPGFATILVDAPPEVYFPFTYQVTVTPAQSTTPAYTIGKNLQISTQIDLGTGFTNPNGTIVTLTSSDPSKLLLSRASTTAGSASVNSAVPAGDRRTQTVYLQGVSVGDVTINVASNGAALAAVTVHVVPSWIGCGPQPATIAVSGSQGISCYFSFTGTNFSAADLGPRAGFSDLTLQLASSAPSVFTVTPSTLTMQASGNAATLRGVGPGTGQVRLTPPSGFGPAPDGSDVVPVTVNLPVLFTGCSSTQVLPRDSQTSCSFGIASGVRVTATSQDRSLLLVSADANTAGAESASATSNSQGVTFTFQGLASYGTAEVVLSAPGYQDFRVAFALRPAEVYLTNAPYPPGPISMRVGGTNTLIFALRASAPRAGANIVVGLSAEPSNIVSITPASLVFSGPQSNGQVQIKGLAAGSALLKVTVPDGFVGPAAPIAVTVLP